MRCQGWKRGAVPCRRTAPTGEVTCTYHRDQELAIRSWAYESIIGQLYGWVCELDPDPAPLRSYLVAPCPTELQIAEHLTPDTARTVA